MLVRQPVITIQRVRDRRMSACEQMDARFEQYNTTFHANCAFIREKEEKRKEKRKERRSRRPKQVPFHNRTHKNYLLFACVETPHSDFTQDSIQGLSLTCRRQDTLLLFPADNKASV